MEINKNPNSRRLFYYCIYLCIILMRGVLFFRLFFWILVLIYPTLMANFCEFLITFCWYDRVFLRCFSIFIYCLIVILAPETTQFLFKLKPNLRFLKSNLIFGVKTQWIIGQKCQNSARYAGAFWEKITFFGRKVNKVPCILGAFWGKNNFLRIFGVKTHWIIGQKSQNSARYAGAFWEKKHFFWKKSQ